MDKVNDAVNHPAHYTDGNIEVIDFIEDKKLSYHLGNAIKYICRAGKKDPDKEIEDLRKAIWYINRYIKRKESRSFEPAEDFEEDCPRVCANCRHWRHIPDGGEFGTCGPHHVMTEAGNICRKL